MTKAEIKSYVRFLLDRFGTGWLQTTDATNFDLDEAVSDGLRRYATETKCFRVALTLAATVGKDTYTFTELGNDRLFDVSSVGFNHFLLMEVNESYLDSINPNWRWAADGTPKYWLKWGGNSIRLFPSPVSTEDIDVEGCKTHADADFNDDADVPAIPTDDHRLIAVWAAMLAVTRGSESTMAEKAPVLFEMWKEGIAAAKMRSYAAAGRGVLLGNMSGPMNLEGLRSLTQFFLAEIDPSMSEKRYDLDQAIFAAYRHYAIETGCFKTTLSINATADVGEYLLSAFGAGAGSRIFNLRSVSYDSKALPQVDENYLDGLDPHWRNAVSGTPLFWVKWGDGKIRLHPAPSDTLSISVSGEETPAPSTLALSTDIPQIHEEDHKLLAVWAALLIISGGDTSKFAEKAPSLAQGWESGVAASLARVQGVTQIS